MFATVPEICRVSEETLATHRVTQLRALSDRFRGIGFTWADGTWRGEWLDGTGHGHEAPGMGMLWLDVADCPLCLAHDFPGWTITRHTGGYEASSPEQVIRTASRSQLVCRLVLADVRPQ